MQRRSQFSPVAYVAYDNAAKRIVSERLPHALRLMDPYRFEVIHIADNPDQYGVDMIARTGKGEKLYVEVEVKNLRIWKDTFPLTTLDFAGRKMKFCGLDCPTIFVVINPTASQMAVTISSALEVAEMSVKENNRTGPEERFIKVPISEVMFFPMKSKF